MADKEQETEEQIFEAASRIFQRKGFAGARMQEIADEADINKSMLHYYFRSKDKLFRKVYQREMSRIFPVLFGVMNSDMPFEEKMEQLIETYYSFLNDNPRLPQFIIYEMNQNPEQFRSFIQKSGIKPPEKFHRQVKEEIEKGNMVSIKPEQLLISIVGLTLFPFIAQTMVQSIFNMDEAQFLQFLKERKDFLLNFILNGINYKRQ